MSSVMPRLGDAINAHDLDAFVALFASEYRSEQPAHPARSFEGAAQVRENWSAVFAGIPDLQADLLTTANDGSGVELGEWHWHGTHVDGSSFESRGVIVLGIEDDLIAWGRLYMEAVEHDGADIGEMVRDTYRPPDGPRG
jgi:hypothetical protein